MFNTRVLGLAIAIVGGLSLLATRARAQIIDPGNTQGTDKYDHWGPIPTGGKVDGNGHITPWGGPQNTGGKVDGGGKVLPKDGMAGKPLCFGDGTGGKCPQGHFGQPGHGCDNSELMGGALLVATGYPKLSKDTMKLQVEGMTIRTTAIFMQGRKVVAPVTFGDGLLCLQGAVMNLGVKRGNYGSAVFPQYGDKELCDAGKVPAIGATVYYQVLYRDETPFNHKEHFNLSNAWETVWVP